ncbi:MAG TPA: hypothetical protein VEB86_07165 [Chryseosolibacter sp.]|nr:hypothetical protein [Chryseosolibacter sp.]
MKTTLALLVIVLLRLNAQAQGAVNDTAFIAEAVKNTISVYDKFLEGQQLFYTGSLFGEPVRTNETHAYLFTDEWSQEALTFDSELFYPVPLLYDITRDQLVTESVSGNMQAIPGDRVDNFKLRGEYFERISKDDYHGSLPRTGFYQVLYDGKTKVISLRQKLVQERVEQNKIQFDYYEKRRYYVLHGGKFIPVKSRKALISLLADRKAELKAHVKNNRVVFKNLELALPGIAMHYDLLIADQK